MMLILLLLVKAVSSYYCNQSVIRTCTPDFKTISDCTYSCADDCCAPNEPWMLGYFRENFFPVHPFASYMQRNHAPCDGDSFITYKARTADMYNNGLSLLGPPTQTVNAYSRVMAYLEWRPDVLVSGITLNNCGPEALLKFGSNITTNITSTSATLVPFILQYIPCQNVYCSLVCGISVTTNNGIVTFLVNSQERADFQFPDVRMWVRNKNQWLKNNSVAAPGFELFFPAICNQSIVDLCSGYYGVIIPNAELFAVCDTSWAQCLHIDDPVNFNPQSSDVLWALSQPGTMDHLQTSTNAVDMILGDITHMALLLSAEAMSIGVVDMSQVPVILISVGFGSLGSRIRGNSALLRAFVGTNSPVVLDPLVNYDVLTMFSGSILPGVLFPNLPAVKDVQVSNPSYLFQNPWVGVWNTRTRYDRACSYEMQYYYKQPQRNYTCIPQPVGVAQCSDAQYCLFQPSWPSLNRLAILGLPVDLYSCFTTTSAFTTLIIDGSPLSSFVFKDNNTWPRNVRLSHNPNLLSIQKLPNSVNKLWIYGNPQLATPVFNQIETALIDVDFSFSQMFIPSSFRYTFHNLHYFACVGCYLTNIPDARLFFPNVSHIDLSFNQITARLEVLVNSSEWQYLLPRLCVMNLSDNAIGGRFPENFGSLVGKGCSSSEDTQLILDNNLIESFVSPGPLKSIGQAQTWVKGFQMFPDALISDVVNVGNAKIVPNNNIGSVWLSLKNNRLKGNLSSIFRQHNLIDISFNNWWCADLTDNCVALPILAVDVLYGLILEADFQNNHTNSNSSSLSSPFWPYALSARESLTLAVTYYNFWYADPSYQIQQLFNIQYGQNNQWLFPQYTLQNSSIGYAAVLISSATNPLSDANCSDKVLRFPVVGTDIFGSASLYGCRKTITGISAHSSSPVFQAKVWMVNACNQGRGVSVGSQCDSCPKNTYSEWCSSCLTPSMNLSDAPFHPSCSSCPISVAPENQQAVTADAGAGGVDKCVCNVGAYGDPGVINNTVASTNCRSCGAFAICPLLNTTNPGASAGYFKESATRIFTLCDPAKACSGGTCADGYSVASKCMACDVNHYRINRECKKCFDAAPVLLAVLAIFLLVALVFLLKASKTDYTKIFTLSISLGYIQIISIFAAFPVTWPAATSNMLNFLSFFNFNFDLASPECAVHTTYYNKWLMKMLLPLIACAVMGLWYVVLLRWPWMQNKWLRFVSRPPGLDRCLLKFIVGRDAKKAIEKRALIQAENMPMSMDPREQAIEWERAHLKNRFICAVITLATVGYTFVAKTSTQPFNCLATPNTLFPHLRADPSVSCYDDLWYSWMPVALFFILIYTAGIPIAFLTILVRAYRNKKLRDADFLSSYGGLILPFREQFWFWELLQLARKLTTVLLIDFKSDTTDTSTFSQINGVLIVLILFFILQEFVRPYDFTWCNRLEFAWTGMSLMILVAALVFSFEGALTSSQINAYAAFLIIALVAAFLVTLYALFLEKRRVLLRVGLGTASHNQIEDDHRVLGSVFGADLGASVFRKTRSMDPEMREKFFAKVLNFSPNQASLEMASKGAKDGASMLGENPSAFPASEEPLSERDQGAPSAPITNENSPYVAYSGIPSEVNERASPAPITNQSSPYAVFYEPV